MKINPTGLRRQRGVAAVEFAIFGLLLCVLAFGISEAGRALYQYNTVAKATRDAARYLTSLPPGTGHAAAKCLAVHGNRTCAGAALAPGLTTALVSIDQYSNVLSTGNGGTATGAMNLVKVTITDFPFRTLVPFVFPDVAFGPISTTMRQVL
jgi:Flp pilus assembly protein TadG